MISGKVVEKAGVEQALTMFHFLFVGMRACMHAWYPMLSGMLLPIYYLRWLLLYLAFPHSPSSAAPLIVSLFSSNPIVSHMVMMSYLLISSHYHHQPSNLSATLMHFVWIGKVPTQPFYLNLCLSWKGSGVHKKGREKRIKVWFTMDRWKQKIDVSAWARKRNSFLHEINGN